MDYAEIIRNEELEIVVSAARTIFRYIAARQTAAFLIPHSRHSQKQKALHILHYQSKGGLPDEGCCYAESAAACRAAPYGFSYPERGTVRGGIKHAACCLFGRQAAVFFRPKLCNRILFCRGYQLK
jgi:hypothetical protein